MNMDCCEHLSLAFAPDVSIEESVSNFLAPLTFERLMCPQHFCFDVNNCFQNVSKISLAEAMQGSLQCLSLENNASDGTDRPLIIIQKLKAPDSQRGLQHLPTTIVGAFTVPYYFPMSSDKRTA